MVNRDGDLERSGWTHPLHVMTYLRSIQATTPVIALGVAVLTCSGCEAGATEGQASASPEVRVEAHEPDQRVDVYVDDQLFTSYVFADTIRQLKKPVLYPINTAEGVPITRAFPLEARAGERVDHPHQIGMWLNYGNVNGLDFWNNSDAIPDDQSARMGTIRHRRVAGVESGSGRGSLLVEAEWITSDGLTVLDEETRYVFHAEPGLRMIDRTTSLTAAGGPVSMQDNKEGVLGLRVRRELEMPAGEALILTDATGAPMSDAVQDDESVTGNYRNSEGVTGYPDVWGTRAEWTALSGVVEGDSVTVAIYDHPQNVGYPTYWHARDYGLFAANPLGQKDLSDGLEELNFALDSGETLTLRYRVAIFSGDPSDVAIGAVYASFAADEGWAADN